MKVRWRIFIAAYSLLSMSNCLAVNSDNLLIDGELVEEPCVLHPGNENVVLSFGSIVIKELYLHERTRGEAFSIQLDECDPSILKNVRVTFRGNTSNELPELLAVNQDNQGVAIGVETLAGQSLPIGVVSDNANLTNGSNMFSFQSYVRGLPSAISSESINPGDLSATMNFLIEYE